MKKMKFSLEPETGTLSERDAKRYFSTVGFATCVLMIASVVGTLLLVLPIDLLAPTLLDDPWISSILSAIPMYGIAFPLFGLILRRLPRDTVPVEPMKGKTWFMGLCVTNTLMMAGNYIGTFFILFFEQAMKRPQTNPVEEATVGQSIWINLIFVAILPPILEELFFRKILCDRLLPLGEGYAIVLSAAVFGLVHGNFFQFFYAFFLGAFFALVYIRTGRIRYSIFYHMIVNLFGGVLMPWCLERIEPMLEESWMTELLTLAEQGNAQDMLTMIQPFVLPMMILLIYEVILFGTAIAGIVIMVQKRKTIRLQTGLIPPPQKGRVANIFLNGGVAAAIAVFAAVFILSLL